MRRLSSLLTGEGGVGEEPNLTTARKPGPSQIIKYSLFMFLVVLVGAPSLKCLSSERWSDLVPSCDKIECPDISTVVKVNN
jgi:hypothetical protein